MRLQAVLSALVVSAAFHLGMAAVFLPGSVAPELQGGSQLAVLSVGTDKLDTLMSGVEALEAEPLETVKAQSVEETAAEASESAPVESGGASRIETTVESEPVDQAIAPDPDPVEAKLFEPLAVARVEVVQSEEGALVRATGPSEEIAAAPDIPVPVPAPARPVTVKKQAEPVAEKAPASKKPAIRKPEKAQAKKANPPAGDPKSAKGGSGGDSRANAKRGSSGTKTAKTSRKEGNAAASNYPGRVYAKISRTRRQRAGGNGTARIRFSISNGGGLAAIVLAKSSGNPLVDDAALAHVKRSAPFPKPPTGAQRSFVIPIQFKR